MKKEREQTCLCVCVWTYALRRVLAQEDQGDEVVDGEHAGQPVPVEVQPHPQAAAFITFPYNIENKGSQQQQWFCIDLSYIFILKIKINSLHVRQC